MNTPLLQTDYLPYLLDFFGIFKTNLGNLVSAKQASSIMLMLLIKILLAF